MSIILAQIISIALLTVLVSTGIFGIYIQISRRQQLPARILAFSIMMYVSWILIMSSIILAQTLYYFVDEPLGATVANAYFIFAPLGIVSVLFFASEVYMTKRWSRIIKVVSLIMISSELLLSFFIGGDRVSPIIIGIIFPGSKPTDTILYFIPIMVSYLFLGLLAGREYRKHGKRVELLGIFVGLSVVMLPLSNALALHFKDGVSTIFFLILQLVNSTLTILFFTAKTDPNPRSADHPLFTITKDLRLKMHLWTSTIIILLVTVISFFTSALFVKSYQTIALQEVSVVNSSPLLPSPGVDTIRWTMIICLTVMEISLGLGIIVLFFAVLGINRILEPVLHMGSAAKKISKGDYGISISRKNMADDELGSTVKAFNYMALAVKTRTEELKEKNREQRDFLNYVAHELRSPISAVQWSLEIAEDELGPEKSRELLQGADKSTKHMRNLVNELLDFSRLERDVLKMNISPISAEKAIDEATYALSDKAIGSSVKIAWEHPTDPLPQVGADPERLNQVLTNIIGNAIKYSAAAATRSSVTIWAETSNHGGPDTADGRYVKIAVHDNGIGIPEDQHDRIFAKFFRAENAVKMDVEGTGLGLYVAKRFTELMGGQIWFESSDQTGTTFYATLPIIPKTS